MAKAIEVTSNIWWVGCGSWGGFNEVLSVEGSGNVFLVGGEGEYALVDGGIPAGVDALLENCAAVGAEPGMIKHVVITHCHGDHMLGVPAIMERTGAAAVAGPLAAKAVGGDEEALKRLFLSHRKAFPDFEVAHVLEEDDEVELGGFTFKAMLTPGHIPDSLSLCGTVGERTVLFTGDTTIGDQGDVKGCVGWLDGHWGSNPRHLLKSIDTIASCDADLMLAGHGLPIDGAEAVGTSLLHCRERVEQLLAIEGLGSMMNLDLTE